MIFFFIFEIKIWMEFDIYMKNYNFSSLLYLIKIYFSWEFETFT